MKTLLVSVAASAVLLTGCGTAKKIAALKPEPGNTTDVVYKQTTSFISLPVSVTVADIENQTNKFFAGVVYEDNDMKADDVALKVTKTAPIKFTEKNGKLESIVPIKVNGKVRYGSTVMGVEMYDTREFDLNAKITFSSDVKLTNWKLKTKTAIVELEWIESPSITVAGKKMPVTYLINPAIKLFKSRIEDELDKALSEAIDFKPQVLDAMEAMAKPILTSEQYQTWFRLTPTELYATDAVLAKKQITMNMGLKCTMETTVGQQPKNTFKKDQVQLLAVKTMPEKVTATVAAVSTYENASKMITKNFQGQEFGDGKRKVTVQKVDLWAKDNKLIVALDMTGSLNGTIYLTGIPNYNAVTKEIYFDQMDYVLDTKSALMRTANWMAGGIILKKIQENCRYSVKENLEDGKKAMAPYLNNYSPMPGVFVNGALDGFDFDKVELTSNAMIAFIKATGKINLKVDGLK
ncbi:DUF4403 family protein [Flavobacterium sp. RHBU_3]|uniref:DUF4403 family protein n=1 Tax=Flavobacterium sp. RHBU_3 TaxID=3391184 RepID=UPI0039854206